MSRNTLIQDLRHTIDCMPMHTRVAMLQGVREDTIIVGAYTDASGGVCPMLAAHRCGGRTSFVSFARTWDKFTGAKRARRATARELRILEGHLTASLFAETGRTELETAIAEHSETARARRSRERQSFTADLGGAIAEHQATARERRAREAASDGGWGFLKGRREARDAERALARAEAEQAFEDRWDGDRERELV